MAFLETPYFPLVLAPGLSGGPLYATDIVEMDSGFESGNPRWVYPKYEYDGATAVKDMRTLYTLLNFFHCVGGRDYWWRFRDLADYKSCAPYDDPTPFDQVIEDDATAGQTALTLIKTYTYGALTRVVPIDKPDPSFPLLLSINDVQVTSGFTLDYTSSAITLDTGLSAHDVVKAGYWFHVPCRFAVDKLETRLESYMTGEARVPIKSVRIS